MPHPVHETNHLNLEGKKRWSRSVVIGSPITEDLRGQREEEPKRRLPTSAPDQTIRRLAMVLGRSLVQPNSTLHIAAHANH